MKKFLTISILALLMLLIGCTLPGPTVDLSVYVYDETGDPVQNASINVYIKASISASTNTNWGNISGTIGASGQTDAEGRYQTQVPAGTYSIQAGKENVNGNWVYNGVTQNLTEENESVNITLDLSSSPTALIVEPDPHYGKSSNPSNKLISTKIAYATRY